MYIFTREQNNNRLLLKNQLSNFLTNNSKELFNFIAVEDNAGD